MSHAFTPPPGPPPAPPRTAAPSAPGSAPKPVRYEGMTPRRLQALVLDLAMVTAAFTPSGKQLTMRCTSGLPDGATFYAAYAREADVVLLYEHPTFAEVRWKDEVPMVRPLGEFRAEDSRV